MIKNPNNTFPFSFHYFKSQSWALICSRLVLASLYVGLVFSLLSFLKMLFIFCTLQD